MFSFNMKVEIPIINNLIFSKYESRPSKTLIDIDIFNRFQKLKVKDLIIYDIIDLEDYNKCEYFLIELSKKMDMDDILKCDFDFDSICVNEFNKITIVFTLESKLTQNNLVLNMLDILNEFSSLNNLYVIFNINNLYNYSNLELVILFSQLFDKFNIYHSKILKQAIIIFKNENENENENEKKECILKILMFIKKVQSQKLYLKNIGFNIDSDIIKFVKNYNICYMKYYINYNNKLVNLNMMDNINIKYYKYNKLNVNNDKLFNNCQHKFQTFSLDDCFICSHCYELFKIY